MGKRIQLPEFLIDLELMFDTLYELPSLSGCHNIVGLQ